MKEERINLYDEGEYTYKAAYGFQPNIHLYLHEDREKRAFLLVVPGGGYCMVCGHEGEVVAREFFERGMNCAVLTYTSDITMSVPLMKQPLMDISRAVRVLRRNSEEWNIISDQLVVCGFSAGGHVCASLCTHFADVQDSNAKYQNISNRPDASLLCYPVITSGEFTHIYSMQALIGADLPEEWMEYFSCEKHVTKDTPPCFLWQTVGDDLVPVENSYLYANALRREKIPYAQYAFPVGGHGMSIANENLARGTYPGDYTYEQLNRALEHVKNHTAIDVSDRRYEELIQQFGLKAEESIRTEETEKVGKETFTQDENPSAEDEKEAYVPAVPDVSLWPELAWQFLKQIVKTKNII